ncbi:hypothetical protein PSECIP111951_03428 [Pseudoalteromonas holothuriae]|uniref:DUF885 domain-containing protein n=1 Tax=Pseudoalteromonas holothuriae TaxID=2963714 RepID=A0ABN8UTL5_9GAMM|nr:DUF885 domain-containing protein [Pseudoalteromonas sp. CIP111951]CAH9065735.1 hypothetical protein PSECIP111951_03428 [Pseudoalteromonas sp. CIP111951]
MVKNFALSLSAVLLSALLSGCQTTPKSSDDEFAQLEQQIAGFRQQVQPYKNRAEHMAYYLPNLSATALAEQQQQRVQLLLGLDNIDTQTLSEENQINYTILRAQIQNKVDEYRFKKHLVPLTSEGGFHSEITQIIGYSDFSKATGFEVYLKRLNEIPHFFEQNIHWMREGMKAGYTQPKVVLKGYEASIEGFIHQDVTQSVFYAPFKLNTAKLPANELAALQVQAQSILTTKVMPAYQDYLTFFIEQYRPAARTSIALKDTPNGQAYYENRAQYYTTTNMSAKQVHELGLKEVARIRKEMESVITEVGFEGTFAEFVHFLRTDPQFYAKTPQQLLKEAAYISKQMDAQLPKLFHTLPRRPYGVIPVPQSIAPKYTTGRYQGASNDLEAGYYLVNTYALDKRPLYVLEALTLHEAVPGHHLQIALNEEMDYLPDYRRNEYISAFGEGWGLYSEYLGLEAGFYQDPYSNFGRLTYEMWRAVRLVVDTGMHMFGWSREQAMDFMKNNTALSLHNVKTETDRYISWPAQALSYKIGELTIKRLRKEAEQKLGAQFDLREFHHQILRHGSVPLFILEEQINQYIDNTLASE